MNGKTSKPRISWSRALTHAVIPSTLLVLAAVGLTVSGGLDKRLLWQTVVGGVLIITAITCWVSYFLQSGRAPIGWGIATASALLVFGSLYVITDFKIKAIPQIPQELRTALRPIASESGPRLEHPLGFSFSAPGLSPNEKLAKERYRAMGGRTDTALWVFSSGNQNLFLTIHLAFPYTREALTLFVDRFVTSTGATPSVRDVLWDESRPEARVQVPSSRRGEIVFRAIFLHYQDDPYLVVLWSEGIPGAQAKKIVDSLKITQALPGPGYIR